MTQSVHPEATQSNKYIKQSHIEALNVSQILLRVPLEVLCSTAGGAWHFLKMLI